jgi:hypothetical protein
MTVCGIAELALEFFEQDFAPARRAVSICNFLGPEISVVFCGVITHADCNICMERANRRGTGSLKRVTHGGSEMICVAVDGHQSLAPALTLKWEGRVSDDGRSRKARHHSRRDKPSKPSRDYEAAGDHGGYPEKGV